MSTVGSATSATTSSTTSSSSTSSALSQNDFLQILITQLKNQDPLSPTDTNEFVTEMCQLTSVQAITNMQTDLDNVASAMNSGAMGQLTSAIGDYMKVSGATISVGDEVVLSPSSSTYDSLTLTLKNSSGTEVTKTFTSSDSGVFNDTDGTYSIVSATSVTNGVSSTCDYGVYRYISGVQSTTAGASLVASDGTTYLTSDVEQIIK